MITLFTVVAPPRSGTKWFSRLLTTDRSFCYHELTAMLQPYEAHPALNAWIKEQVADHSPELAQRRWVLQRYPEYFARHWERATFGQHIVGNSDAATIDLVPGLWSLWPDMKFIFSIRNGIRVVQSRTLDTSDFTPGVLAKNSARWGTDDIFQILCHRWVKAAEAIIAAKDWVAQRAPAAVFQTRLEKITTDLEEIEKLWNWIGIGDWERYAERNASLQLTPVNARTSSERFVQPEEIWERWTPDQRQHFRAICGEMTSRAGYELPR